jgi:hypothetical protein
MYLITGVYYYKDLVVKEWESCDKLVKTIESRRDKVLTVVTKELKGGKHGKASV